MSLKIDQDHSRFRNIVRGKIRQNLRKYISQGELIGRKGKDLVSIPIPQIDIPRFRFGDKQRAASVRATATRAIRSAATRTNEAGARQGRARRRRARARGRRHARRARRDPRRGARAAATSRTRARARSSRAKDRYTGIRRVGPESLRHFKRTYREALKRMIASGTLRPGQPDRRAASPTTSASARGRPTPSRSPTPSSST